MISSRKKKRLFFLDFIRASSVVIIVLYHTSCTLKEFNISVYYNLFGNFSSRNWGFIGVALFFMITGCSLYYNYKDRLRLKEFYKKRILSLYPAFYIAYFSIFLFHFYNSGRLLPIPKRNFILTLLGLDGYLSPFIQTFYIIGEWFLGAIILCYILFPLLLKVYKKHYKLLLIILTITSIILCYHPILFFSNRNPIYTLTFISYGMFFIDNMNKINVKLLPILIPLIIIIYVVKLPINEIVLSSILSILIFMILYIISNYIKNKYIFNILSDYSYYIFLVHHYIINYISIRFRDKMYGMTERTIVVIIICIVIAFWSYLLKKTTDKVNLKLKKLIN